MPNSTQYAHVILPLAVNGYTYVVPLHLHGKVQVGSLVQVPLGKTKHYLGVVSALQNKAPQGVQCKEVMQVVSAYPMVTAQQLQLWNWMASRIFAIAGPMMPVWRRDTQYFRPLSIT